MATLNLSTTISFYMGNTSLCSIFFILIQVLFMFAVRMLWYTSPWVHKGCVSMESRWRLFRFMWESEFDTIVDGRSIYLFGLHNLNVSQSCFTGTSMKNMSKHLLSLKFGWAVFTHPWTPHPQDLNAQTNNGIKSQTCYFQDRFVTQLQFRDFNRLGDN